MSITDNKLLVKVQGMNGVFVENFAPSFKDRQITTDSWRDLTSMISLRLSMRNGLCKSFRREIFFYGWFTADWVCNADIYWRLSSGVSDLEQRPLSCNMIAYKKHCVNSIGHTLFTNNQMFSWNCEWPLNWEGFFFSVKPVLWSWIKLSNKICCCVSDVVIGSNYCHIQLQFDSQVASNECGMWKTNRGL